MQVNEIRTKTVVSLFDTGAYNNGSNLVDLSGFRKSGLFLNRLGIDFQSVRV